MKKYICFFACCLAMTLAAASVHAQFWGFTGQQVGFAWPQGFTGQFAPVPVAQVVHWFPNKAQAVLQGNIVAFLGSDRYLFRDASGDIVVKIKRDRWWGQIVGPNDVVELGGELKRDKKSQRINYFDARVVRRVGQGPAPTNESLMLYQGIWGGASPSTGILGGEVWGSPNTGILRSGESEGSQDLFDFDK